MLETRRIYSPKYAITLLKKFQTLAKSLLEPAVHGRGAEGKAKD